MFPEVGVGPLVMMPSGSVLLMVTVTGKATCRLLADGFSFMKAPALIVCDAPGLSVRLTFLDCSPVVSASPSTSRLSAARATVPVRRTSEMAVASARR